MLSGPARCALWLGVAVAALLGCADTIRVQEHPALYEQRAPLRRVAVAPFAVKLVFRAGAEGPERAVPDAAAAQVARYLAEALEARGLEVVAPEDLNRALLTGSAVPDTHQARRPGDPRPVAWTAKQRFGAGAVVIGQLYRFKEREGSDLGSTSPASVGFEVKLYSAPEGKVLWTGVFDETQRAVSENVLNAGRYPGGGSRWLTAEELARWGAQEMARQLPAGAPGASGSP